MRKSLLKNDAGITDFQIAFVLHLYSSLSNDLEVIRIRPDRRKFPLTLGEVTLQIGGIFKEIGIEPDYVAISNRTNIKLDYSNIGNESIQDYNLIFEGDNYLACLTEDILNYEGQRWSMKILLKNSKTGNIEKIKKYLTNYRDKYLEEKSAQEIQNSESKLMTLTFNDIGILHLPFIKTNSSDLLSILITHIIGLPEESYPGIEILPTPLSEYFPHSIMFKTNFMYFDFIPRFMNFVIGTSKVTINDIPIFSNRDTKYATKIMRYIAEKRVQFQINNAKEEGKLDPIEFQICLGDIMDYIKPKKIYNRKIGQVLRVKLDRMDEVILKKTGIEFFDSIGRTLIEVKPNIYINLQ